MSRLIPPTLLALLSACATQPIGPTVQVLPAAGKPFDVFAQEETYCKNYAQGQIAGAVQQANNAAIGTGILTAGLGTAAGALIGGGYGARAGLATGAVAGGAVGADYSANSQIPIQQRYDTAYTQCMYAKGNQVPGADQSTAQLPPAPPPAPAPQTAPPPPPPPQFDPQLVAAIQQELARLGLLSGPPDGAYGQRTRAAIVDFEGAQNLPRDGVPSYALLQTLQKS
jgi:hypothetical protein